MLIIEDHTILEDIRDSLFLISDLVIEDTPKGSNEGDRHISGNFIVV